MKVKLDQNKPATDFSLLKFITVHKVEPDNKGFHDVFGVVLFTEKDPYVAEVLEDQKFWKALDSISGPRWPIFAIRPKPGFMSKVTPARSSPTRTYGFMVAFNSLRDCEWTEPEDNERLRLEFGITTTEGLPMLLVFYEPAPNDIVQMRCRFSAGSKDECYNSLKTVIEKAAYAIEQVTDDNIKSTPEVFSLIQNELKQYILFRRIQKGISIAEWLKSLTSIFP